MYACQTLDEVSQTCLEWVVADVSYFAFSQNDAFIIGQFLVSFFVLCCGYAVITKALKLA